MGRQVKVIDKLEIVPQGEFILVKVDQEDDEKTAGGIIIPVGALQNKKTQTGVIVGVGKGRRSLVHCDVDDTELFPRIPMDCQVGQRILFACFIGYPIMIAREEHVIIKFNDIMGFVNEVAHMVEDDGTLVTDDKRSVA